MDILVVGARGFLGSALIRHAHFASAMITCVTRGPTPVSRVENHRWLTLDHLSQSSWDELFDRRYDIIYHLGWSSIPRTAELDPVADVVENVSGGLRLLSSIRRLSPESRLIFSSSGGTIYGRAERSPIDENTAPRPISAYGAAKQTFENYLHLNRRQYGLQFICARISNPYGPGQSTTRAFGAVSTFVERALNDEQIQVFGSSSIVRDYIYISDLCDAMAALSTIDNGPDAVNIASGVGTSLGALLSLVEERLQKEVKWTIVPGRSYDIETVVLDRSLVTRLTGWEPTVDLRTGIDRLIAFFKDCR